MVLRVASGSIARRMLAALVLVGVLTDASACLMTYSEADTSQRELRISALCPCGCKAHTGALAGIGLTQLAAAPAEIALPDSPRSVLEPRTSVLPPRAPVEPIDHVPILDA